MRNLILTICLSVTVSLAFCQIHVTGPNGGNVGIGITNPTQKLDVSGNLLVRGPELNIGKWAGANQASLQIGFERGSNGKASFELIADKSNYPDWGFRFVRFSNGFTNVEHRGSNSLVFSNVDGASTYFGDSGNAKFSVHSNKIQSEVQAYKPGGGPWQAISDKRTKKDINSYHKGLKELLEIEPVSYKYLAEFIKDHNKTYVGVIAQDLQKVVPSMVKDYEYIDMTSKKHSGYLSVDPNEFTYMLINAVKELESQLKELTQEVKDLKSSPSIINSTIEGSGKAYLEQNTPNPLKQYTRIEYFIPQESSKAFLTVQNLAGQLIQRIDITEMGKGFIELKLKDMPAGVYSYRLKVDGITVDTKKMILE